MLSVFGEQTLASEPCEMRLSAAHFAAISIRNRHETL